MSYYTNTKRTFVRIVLNWSLYYEIMFNYSRKTEGSQS